MPDRIVSLVNDLIEHPGTRPHLERHGICYRLNEQGRIFLACSRCNESPCACGDLHRRGSEYMVAIYADSALRPLFEARRLAVRS